jgi:hypothetical protein
MGEQRMYAYAAEAPTRKPNARRHSAHPNVRCDKMKKYGE